MSPAVSPLILILISGVELGLDGDDGLGILLPTGGCFVLDVHDERSTGVEAVGGGRAGELRRNTIDSLGTHISGRHHLQTKSSRDLGLFLVVPIIREVHNELRRCPHSRVLPSPQPRAQGALRQILQFPIDITASLLTPS